MRSASSGLAVQTAEGPLPSPVPFWAIDAIDAVAISAKATMLCARFIRFSVRNCLETAIEVQCGVAGQAAQFYESSTSRTFRRNTSLARYIVVTIVEFGT
jgi:hypothetical protein